MQRLGAEIKKTANLMSRNFTLNRKSDDKCLPQMQRRVIGYLYHNGENEIFQKDIEKQFSICRSSASGLILRMENNGLIRRVPVSGDKRLKRLVLTDKCKDVCNNIERNISEFETSITDGINKEDIDVCVRVLSVIQQNLAKLMEANTAKGVKG